MTINTEAPWTPDVPGRGAWTLQGGLVNNSGGVTGYYQSPGDGDKSRRPGALFTRGDTTDAAFCVHRAVKVIQRYLNLRVPTATPLVDNGVWNADTEEMMSAWQEQSGLSSTSGIFGPRTAQEFYKPQMVSAGRANSIPWTFLYGIAFRESGFDPAAVGSNGYDHGLVQINLDPRVHGKDVSRIQALNPAWCLHYAADEIHAVYVRWNGHTTADPWDIAIANHNSPALAQQWATTGEPPVVEGRIFQIEDYVIDVRTRADTI